MTFFANAAGHTLLAIGLFSFGLYAWDTNGIPYRKLRAAAWFLASLLFLMSAAAWVLNGITQGQTEYGRLIQEFGWVRVGLPGATATVQTILAYRQRRIDRARLVATQIEFLSDPISSVV